MSTIDIKRAHSLPVEEARKRAEEIAKSMQERFGIQWKWDEETIRFDAPSGAAKGTKGELHVTAQEVRIEIDLPFMLRLLKGSIEDKVTEKLDKLL